MIGSHKAPFIKISLLLVLLSTLTFGFRYLPNIYHAFLMSATLDEDVKSIKKLVLHNPVIVKLEETNLPDSSQLTQYHIKLVV